MIRRPATVQALVVIKFQYIKMMFQCYHFTHIGISETPTQQIQSDDYT